MNHEATGGEEEGGTEGQVTADYNLPKGFTGSQQNNNVKATYFDNRWIIYCPKLVFDIGFP